MTRGAEATIVALLLLAGPIWTAPQSGASIEDECRPWRRVQSPPVESTALQDVGAASGSDIWAVGDNGLNPVIEHYDGEQWSLARSPDVFAYLDGVRAFSSDDAWAVGNQGYGGAFAEHWDGSKWSVAEVPQGGEDSTLYAIDGTSASDIWAVGKYTDTDSTLKGLAEHWDGSTWTVVPMDDVSPFLNIMYSVEAIAPDDVWAVGYQEIDFAVNQPLAEHWDGTAWTAVPIDPPPSANANFFYDVSASSSTDVWAVGTYGDSFPLMEHWDGTSWKRYAAPAQHLAWGVATISPTNAWAGGTGAPQPTGWHWDGTSWSLVPTPRMGYTAVVGDLVAISPGDIWAVGTYGPRQGGSLLPLILRSNGACR